MESLAGPSVPFSSRRSQLCDARVRYAFVLVRHSVAFRPETTKHTVMIHPQVHLRIPCYDFYFLYSGQFAHLLGTPRASREASLRDQFEELINWSDR